MAKLKIETNRDTELVKFCSIEESEIFIHEGKAFERYSSTDMAICLNDGHVWGFKDDDLVTYVRKAELKLTI